MNQSEKLNLFLLLVIGMSLIGYFIFVNIDLRKPDEISPADLAPSIRQAPYIIESKGWYVRDYYEWKDRLVLTDFYLWENNRWNEFRAPMYLNRNLPEYRDLQIVKREQDLICRLR